MGYTSDVFFKTTKKGFEILKKYNDSLRASEQFLTGGPLERCLTIQVSETTAPMYKLTYTNVKWYNEYDEIQRFNAALDTLNNKRVAYKFIRLGENLNDIETRENLYLDYSDPSEVPSSIADFEVTRDIYDPPARYDDYVHMPHSSDDSCSLEDNPDEQVDALNIIFNLNSKGDD